MPGTVLVVDDDEFHRRLVGRWLERAGYAVIGVPDGRACLEALSAHAPDALLLDLHMEGTSGLDVLDAVQRRDLHVPVVVLTADERVPTVVEAMRRGARGYLTKPVDREAVLESVARATAAGEAGLRDRARARRSAPSPAHGLVGDSAAMEAIQAQIDRVGPTDVTVLVLGETGTGKELVARALHAASARASAPFVAINCAAIPDTLQESELFGHEKGAFTGATGDRKGRFEQAHGGTLFLDEVGEIAPETQAKLLRALQERRFHRVGGSAEVAVDVRLVAATHQDLPERVRRGEFREDLFWRLAVYELELPALRDRPGDVERLAAHFLAELAATHGRAVDAFDEAALECLRAYPWPGNVRELRNTVERAVVASSGPRVGVADLPPRLRGALRPVDDAPGSLAELEERAIRRALDDTGGNVSEAVRRLGVPRSTLYRRLRAMGLR